MIGWMISLLCRSFSRHSESELDKLALSPGYTRDKTCIFYHVNKVLQKSMKTTHTPCQIS